MSDKKHIEELAEFLRGIDNAIVCLHPEINIAQYIFAFFKKEGCVLIEKDELIKKAGLIVAKELGIY